MEDKLGNYKGQNAELKARPVAREQSNDCTVDETSRNLNGGAVSFHCDSGSSNAEAKPTAQRLALVEDPLEAQSVDIDQPEIAKPIQPTRPSSRSPAPTNGTMTGIVIDKFQRPINACHVCGQASLESLKGKRSY